MMMAAFLISGGLDTTTCAYSAKNEDYEICASLGYYTPCMAARGHTCSLYHFRREAFAAIGRHDPVPYEVN